MKTKVLKMQFGDWDHPPEETEPINIEVPEDMVFFANKPDEGPKHHIGAWHVVGLTKATDEELDDMVDQHTSIYPYTTQRSSTSFEYARINGYALIEFRDVSINETYHLLSLMTQDDIEEFLKIKETPVYIVELNEENRFNSISRIDHFVTAYDIQISQVNLFNSSINLYTHL